MMLTYKHSISCLCRQKCYKQYRYYLLKMSVNGVSTIFGVATWIIKGQYNGVNPELNYQPPLWAKMLCTVLQLPPKNERQRSMKSFCEGSVSCTATYCTVMFLNQVISHQSSVYIPIFNFTTMHAMSHRSDFYPCL